MTMRWIILALGLIWGSSAMAATLTLPSVVVTGTVTGTCPKGTAFIAAGDGCQQAPACTPGTKYCTQELNFFTGYTGINYAVRPPWNVPGVDYAVGIHDSCVASGLKDPSVNPPPGTSFSGHTLTVTGANVVINCYDFSLHNGITILCTTGSGTLTVTDNYFLAGSGQSGNGTGLALTTISGCSANPDTEYNSVNDTVANSNAYTSFFYWAGSGNPTAKYNATWFSAKDFYHDVHAGGVTTTVSIRYNYGQGLEGALGAHTQPYLSYGGPTANDDESWNVFYADSTSHNGFALCTFNNSYQTNKQTSPSCNNNVLVTALAGGKQSTGGLIAVYPNTAVSFTGNNNYLDSSGSYFPWYVNQNLAGVVTTSSGNVNMIDGKTCNAYATTC